MGTALQLKFSGIITSESLSRELVSSRLRFEGARLPAVPSLPLESRASAPESLPASQPPFSLQKKYVVISFGKAI
jgi:hypothetical protein